MLVIPILILVIESLVISATSNDLTHTVDVSLDQLCKYKNVHLTTQSQLRSLNVQTRKSGVLGVCPSDITNMVNDFFRLVHDGSENVCTMETALRFKDFYLKYVDRSVDKTKKSMPKSMKRFVLAYGMQMSNMCRKNMLEVISAEGNDLLQESDLARLGMWISDDGPLRKLLNEMNQPGEIIMPTDLAILLSRNDSTLIETMYIQSKATRTIKRYKEACKKRFEPIYEPLIMPLVTLAGIGFNYADKEYKTEFKVPEKLKALTKWTDVVFMCEAMKMVEPIEFLEAELVPDETSEDKPLEKPDEVLKTKGMLRLLTKEEAETINKALLESDRLGDLMKQENMEALTLVEYVPDFKVQIGDLILNKTDSKLMKSIRSFKSNKSHMQRVKNRLVRSSLLTVRSMLLKLRIRVVATAAAKATWHRLKTKKKNVGEEEVNKALVKMVEEMADKAIEDELKKNKKDAILFIVVLICGLGLLALGTWGIITAIGGLAALVAAIAGFVSG